MSAAHESSRKLVLGGATDANASARRDPTQRFGSRVELYRRWRPSYPPQLLDILRRECALTTSSCVVDIGAGTGLLTRLLLDNGNAVIGVEPNDAMRAAAEDWLAGCARFTSVAATAEATTLPDASVDLIVAAQAFHWFDRDAARREFARILRADGWVALIWHERLTHATPFLREYERLLCDYCLDYREVDHRNIDETALAAFFSPAGFREAQLPFRQVFDLEALRGRTMSASYMPEPGHPRFEPMVDALTAAFVRHARDGVVVFEYATRVFYGTLNAAV